MKPSTITSDTETKVEVTPASMILLAITGVGVLYAALRLTTRRRARSAK